MKWEIKPPHMSLNVLAAFLFLLVDVESEEQDEVF